VIAIAIAAAVLLLLGSEGPSVSAPIAIGRPPLRIAASSQAVWVTSGRDGTITRLDPETGKPLGKPLHPGFGVAGIAIGGRWVWVTNPLRGRLLRLDPKSGRVLKTIDVGGRPGPIALGGGRVWIADEGGRGVTAVNSEGGRIYRRGLPPQTTNLRLAFGARGLWVSIAGTGSVRRIDPADFTTGAPILVGRGPAGLVVADGLVWVANSRSGTVTKIDFGSGEPDGDPIAVGPEPGAVAVGGEAVWVANNGDGTVTRIEP
jgi:DNA-binding beta-propeller fold protein YncE